MYVGDYIKPHLIKSNFMGFPNVANLNADMQKSTASLFI